LGGMARIVMNKKLTRILGQTNRSFASVFLAFGLFGFLFPHNTTPVTQNHQVNLRAQTTTSQTESTMRDDRWFY
jgi:hypothetical protein